MARGPKGERRPADVICAAVEVMGIATGEDEDTTPPESGKDPAAVSMGERGGAARPAAMTPGRKAAAKRWAKLD